MKAPIIILHGWNLSSKPFSPLARSLRKKGYPVYAPDLPGFGASKMLERVWTLADYSHWLAKKLKQWKIKQAILVGHSFGGRVSLRFASDNPSMVSCLILSGTPGFPPVSHWKAQFFRICAKIGKKLFVFPIFSPLQDFAQLLLYRFAGATDYFLTDTRMKQTFQKVVGENLIPYMKSCRIPTLLVWGADDRIVPLAVGEKMEKTLPFGTLISIQDARHGVVWTHADVVAHEIVSFVQKKKKRI